MKFVLARLFILGGWLLLGSFVSAQETVVITEFLADNSGGLLDDRTRRARASGMASARLHCGDRFWRNHLGIAHDCGRALPVRRNLRRHIHVPNYLADVRFDLSLAAHPIGRRSG